MVCVDQNVCSLVESKVGEEKVISNDGFFKDGKNRGLVIGPSHRNDNLHKTRTDGSFGRTRWRFLREADLHFMMEFNYSSGGLLICVLELFVKSFVC